NGVSLGNPRLAFVCVSEDMTGEFGLCGYFREFDRDLHDDERLQFANGEIPPPFDPDQQPKPPADEWDEVRLDKANRNYALEYVRNGLCELANVIGRDDARELGRLAARLIGLQYFAETAAMIGARDGDLADAARYLGRMFEGMGDAISIQDDGGRPVLRQRGCRVARGLVADERDLVLDCWIEIWRGALASQRTIKTLDMRPDGDALSWHIAVLERSREHQRPH
ncbi:MAG TPA: hypothetical protein VFG38_02665, partial [Pseudomonadales bacterium]|nr:hypothetical protein [Pseudomonadales bacterium]